MDEEFFDDPTEQSRVKADIVQKYFWVWAQVVGSAARARGGKVAYVDLFSGPGRYKDGTKSTPLLVLERAIGDPKIRGILVTVFNDAKAEFCEALKRNIAGLPGIDSLTHQPQVFNLQVGAEMARVFSQTSMVPTLAFCDPFGYKGLSLGLIRAFVKDWGCDAIFFFNYNRVNMGLKNPLVEDHMNALFGRERAEKLRDALNGLRPHERVTAVVDALTEALGDAGAGYVLPFCFGKGTMTHPSHYLVFATKHIKGYDIMKGIMAKESSSAEQGVPCFGYCPADGQFPALFEYGRPLDELAGRLMERFAGCSLTMDDIYRQHNVGTPYMSHNYKEVLAKLEAEGKVRADPSAEKRRRGTFANDVCVTFPGKRVSSG